MKRPDSTTGPPPEFLSRMRALLPADEYAAFAAAFDRPPRAGLRVNTLKISVADFTSIAPFPLAPVGEWEPAGFIVAGDSRPGRHPYHDAGLYYLQEPSAMVPAALLAPRPGELVLDLAAAPGGKATHLAALMAEPAPAASRSPLRRMLDVPGLLVANDVHTGRARLLADNLARWGALNVVVTNDKPERLSAAFGPVFDRVLIDAPCSGEGMFRRGEAVEWSAAIVAACARRQRGVLAVATELARPGGRLLYSTCTFAPEENEEVIAAFLAAEAAYALEEPRRFAGFERGRPEWAAQAGGAAGANEAAAQLARAVRLWPHTFPGEGHFIALISRDEAEPHQETHQREYRGLPPSAEEHRLWREFACETLAFDLPAGRLHAHNGRLYLLPRTTLDPGRIRLVRYGLLLGEARRGYFRPAHDLALALTAADVQAAANWPANDPRMAAYLAGSDLPDEGPDGWRLMTVDGYGLGWARRAGGRLKNHYPHHLRRKN
jgi:16S rRNA C967 or C1407 C5-methylase (RsmB/RsmF family)/NOL1/NOP2/fmu family ribosome biogenesis protein